MRMLPLGKRQLLLCALLSTFILNFSQASFATERTAADILPVICDILLRGDTSPTSPPPTLPPAPPEGAGHDWISEWQGTATCLQCHQQEAEDVFSSVHYQWLGETPYMTDGPDLQGKLNLGVNSYCINITGNWNGCGNCHVGLGAPPEQELSPQQLMNIDCLVCHQAEYKRKKVKGAFVPDLDNMSISMVEAARTVHLPNRAVCLQCHAKGGGGDNYKRGDMALAHSSTGDRNFDVHMATTGADLDCQSCHTTENHRMAGKGSDLRPTDLQVNMNCTDCHITKLDRNGHSNTTIGNHVARIACQTCHIDRYARNASDTTASEETEIHRDWQTPHVTKSGAIHPASTLAGNLKPVYAWWDGTSDNYVLYEKVTVDQVSGRVATSRPLGSVDTSLSRLYPFKYKTALQPLASQTDDLIALDTSVYFTSGDSDQAIVSGLVNMGYSGSAPYQWVVTETYQLITHEVAPSSAALACLDCHDSTARMDLQGDLGYALKGSRSSVCTQCHGNEDVPSGGYRWIHAEHVSKRKYTCSKCHAFSRPERTELR